MEIDKFIFGLKNKMLPIPFHNCFTNLSEINKYNARQKAKSGYYHYLCNSEFERKRLN